MLELYSFVFNHVPFQVLEHAEFILGLRDIASTGLNFVIMDVSFFVPKLPVELLTFFPVLSLSAVLGQKVRLMLSLARHL